MDPLAGICQTLKSPNFLIDKHGRPFDLNAIQKSKIFVLYFSAHWCPPCRQFTPILAEQYRQYRQISDSSTVIFVSGDRSAQDQLNYMQEAHGDWPAIPFGSPLQSSLQGALQVRGIPAVIVIKASNGEILSRDARQEIMQNGMTAFLNWDQSCLEVDTSIVNNLLDNPDQVFLDAKEILLKLLSNILRDSQNIKFRRIRLSNPKIESMLLNASGAFETLFSIGFEEDTDALFLPLSANLEILKAYKEAIEKLQPKKSAAETAVKTTTKLEPDVICSGDLCIDLSKERPLADYIGKTDDAPPLATPLPKITSVPGCSRFIEWAEKERQVCLARENKLAHKAVHEIIPIDSLEKAAKDKFKLLFSEDGKIPPSLLRDLAVHELVKWFKNDFFSWVDKLQCDTCQVDMMAIGNGSCNAVEIRDGAVNVEMYQCRICSRMQRFPRYSLVPEKLLQTRQGRCGEWANCFALILRAFGFLVRHVNDFADHVWCEFYSETEHKWVHVDPCEGIIDKPKVYDCGWGKKLAYVMAASIHEVQDVTKRYVVNHDDVKPRRNLVSEDWLNKFLLDVTDHWQSNLSAELKKKLAEMRLVELAELMFAKKELSEDECQGRQSGSLAWRLARQETKSDSANAVIKPTKEEEKAEKIELSYDINRDCYTRSVTSEVIEGWTSMTYQIENVIKKEESDWKMVYLARKDGSCNGKISWKIDLTSSGYLVKNVELYVESKVFESGKIMWSLQGDSKSIMPIPGITMKSEELSGSKSLILQASLSGGKGEVAWQHTQLFRTELGKTLMQQLKFIIHLKKSD